MAASSGLVAPITWRAAAIALLALEHHRHQRAGGDEVDQLLVERLALVLGVVLRGQLAGHGHQLQGDEPQSLALEAGDYLARQVAGKGIGLDKDERALHGGGPSGRWVTDQVVEGCSAAVSDAALARRALATRGRGGHADLGLAERDRPSTWGPAADRRTCTGP